MKTYTIANQKGGTGKSALAGDFTAALAADGQRVLAIDADSQRSFTQRLGFPAYEDPAQSLPAYTAGVATAAELAVSSPTVLGVHVMRANKSVKRMPAEEVTQLRDLLPRERAWDACVIDTPGDLEATVTRAALVAADVVVLAVECKAESVDGLDETMDLLNGRIANLRRGLPPQRLWLVPSRLGRNSVGREVVDQLRDRFPGQVTNPIPEATVIAETYMALMPTRLYRPRSKGAQALATACQTIITGKV